MILEKVDPQIKPGDVVFVKIAMTVKEETARGVLCSWFVGDQVFEAEFDRSVLIKD